MRNASRQHKQRTSTAPIFRPSEDSRQSYFNSVQNIAAGGIELGWYITASRRGSGVVAYYLIAEDTIEESMMRLLEDKHETTSIVHDGKVIDELLKEAIKVGMKVQSRYESIAPVVKP